MAKVGWDKRKNQSITVILARMFLLLTLLLCGIADSYIYDAGDCGIRYEVNRYEPTISYGTVASINEFPWHVALYKDTNSSKGVQYICGGSIVHPTVILTAAHCIYNEAIFQIDSSMMYVATGKYNSSWDHMDTTEQRFQVTSTVIPRTYLGIINRYADDIALLILNDTISFSSIVMPICVDWNGNYDIEGISSVGTIVGWGLTEKGILSDKLLSAELQFYNFTKCRDKVSEGFTSFVTSDKFCAGVENCSEVEKGDSGGGLTFPRTIKNRQQYFIFGILSAKDTYSKGVAAFTNIGFHLNWLNSNLKSIAREQNFKKECGIMYEVNRFEPLIAHGSKTKHNEFPWHVALFVQNDDDDGYHYICGGNIITDKAILTAAHCVYDEENETVSNKTYIIAVGKYHISWDQMDPHEQRFKVIEISIPFTYGGKDNRYADDIAILTLNKSITFSSIIMPICIDWNSNYNLDTIAKEGIIVGWGVDEKGDISETLQSAKFEHYNFIECRKLISNQFKQYITSDKRCIAPNKETHVNPGDTGGGFILPVINEKQKTKYFIYGLLDIKDKQTEYAGIIIVSYHMQWIKNILKYP